MLVVVSGWEVCLSAAAIPYHFTCPHGVEWNGNHCVFVTEIYLKKCLIPLCCDIAWPAHSPNVSPCYYFLWRYLKAQVFKCRLQITDEVKDFYFTWNHCNARSNDSCYLVLSKAYECQRIGFIFEYNLNFNLMTISYDSTHVNTIWIFSWRSSYFMTFSKLDYITLSLT